MCACVHARELITVQQVKDILTDAYASILLEICEMG